MNEDFLQYVWKFQQFSGRALTTTLGQSIDVLNPGEHNTNAGPDFLNARLRIGKTLWAGNVEVHINASDWFRHNHHLDPAYSNVILHVVYTPDAPVLAGQETPIPVLRLDELIDYQSYRYYKAWLSKPNFIPCEASVLDVPKSIKYSAIESSAIERLSEKSEALLDQLNITKGDQEEVFHRSLCRSMGLKVNAMPFEHFGSITPIKLIRRIRADVHDLHAFFLGQAGFLDNSDLTDPYVIDLQKRFQFIKRKHGLKSMEYSSWKFSRLRPPSFPTIRLVQLAEVYSRHSSLAQKMIECEGLKNYEEIFSVNLNDAFWKDHFTLKAPSKSSSEKSLGIDTIHLILINSVIPFLFAMSSFSRDSIFQEKALALLESMPAENNLITRSFQKLDFPSDSALCTQGLLGLKKSFCDKKQCLNCKIGVFILNESCKD